jgi:hypothetical protein
MPTGAGGGRRGLRDRPRGDSLGEAAAAAGVAIDAVVALNGELVGPDPALPLVAGDVVVLAGG